MEKGITIALLKKLPVGEYGKIETRMHRNTHRQTKMLAKILVGRYQIVKHLGRGGFGETFIAQDTHLPGKPECVVKKLKTHSTDSSDLQTARRLFDTEAQVLHKLGNHSQIPQLLAYLEDNQEFYLVQEFIVGHDLNQELTPGEEKDEQQVICLLIEILQILDFVHQQQVIHRDINPGNILRREQDNKLVLIDFGAVKQISTQIFTPEGTTKSTVVIGTPGYIPAEQAQGAPKFNSDIYALGIIGIQALTGLAPEELEKDEETHEIIWRNEAQVSPELGQILDMMVRYDFRQRFSSAAVVLESLRNLGKEKAKTSKTFVVSPKLEKIKAAIPRKINYKKIFIKSLIGIILVSAGVIASISVRNIFYLENAKDLYQKANTFYELKRYEDAIESYEKAVDIRPDFFQAWNGLGKTFYDTKRYKEASKAYDSAIQLNPNDKEAWRGRGFALYKLGKYEDAIDSFNKALKLDDKQPEVWNALGEALSKINQYSQAIPAYDNAIKLNRKFDLAWDNKGKALHKQHRYKDAVEAYKQATGLKIDNAEAWYNLGNSQARLKDYKEALEAYDNAVRYQPNYSQAWLSKGNMLVNLRRYEKAVESFEQVIKYQPKNYNAWFNKGWSLHEIERYESAIDAYDRAISIRGNDYNSWYNKGNSLYKLKRNEEAIKAYDMALSYQPEHFGSLYSKGNVLFDMKRYKGALKAYEAAIKIKPNHKKAKKARDKAEDELEGRKSLFGRNFSIKLW